MSSQEVQFLLPDLLSICPLKGDTNPYYKEAGAESAAWINSYNVFTDRKRAYFIQGVNELLVCNTYPYAGYEQFRTCCDFVNLLFVVDEVSDDQSGADARATVQLFLSVMKDPQSGDDSILAQMTRDFRARLMRLAGPRCSARFLENCKKYVDAVAREAELREAGRVLDLESFMPLRRNNSAVPLCFSLIEYALGTNLPDEVFEDPNFVKAYLAGVDLVCWSNDIYSYNVEQAKGHSGNNIITVLMQEKNIGLQAACDIVGTYSAELMSRYISGRSNVPSWGPSVDAEVSRYLDGIAYWIRGNLEWSFQTQRYFGHEHEKIKATRLVTLRPQGILPEDFEEFESESDSK